MKLYYSPGACSLSPHIVAREAGLPVELVRVDLKAHKTADGRDYYQINPRGYVPALELDDGTLLREGPAIVQYLADQAPGSGLAPAPGTLERVRLQEWLTYIGTEIHKMFGWLFNPRAPDEAKNIAREKINARFADIERHLAGKSYLLGDNFSPADAYLFVTLNWANVFKLDLDPYPNLKAYHGRVRARPKVQEALRAEGLIKE